MSVAADGTERISMHTNVFTKDSEQHIQYRCTTARASSMQQAVQQGGYGAYEVPGYGSIGVYRATYEITVSAFEIAVYFSFAVPLNAIHMKLKNAPTILEQTTAVRYLGSDLDQSWSTFSILSALSALSTVSTCYRSTAPPFRWSTTRKCRLVQAEF